MWSGREPRARRQDHHGLSATAGAASFRNGRPRPPPLPPPPSPSHRTCAGLISYCCPCVTYGQTAENVHGPAGSCVSHGGCCCGGTATHRRDAAHSGPLHHPSPPFTSPSPRRRQVLPLLLPVRLRHGGGPHAPRHPLRLQAAGTAAGHRLGRPDRLPAVHHPLPQLPGAVPGCQRDPGGCGRDVGAGWGAPSMAA